MTKQEALDGSIQKWVDIVAGDARDEGQTNCPLCGKYWWSGLFRKPCDGCPVAEDTGKTLCDGTPYQDYRSLHSCMDCEPWPDRQKIARAMLRYLKNLRKKMYGGEV